mmetsp:Transcript_12333/g.33302  ORF Transcript_12333/g.33302 Transcript_12333/m.33302 type:complete len:243 (+) Transcript_12333:1380-2108(+)
MQAARCAKTRYQHLDISDAFYAFVCRSTIRLRAACRVARIQHRTCNIWAAMRSNFVLVTEVCRRAPSQHFEHRNCSRNRLVCSNDYERIARTQLEHHCVQRAASVLEFRRFVFDRQQNVTNTHWNAVCRLRGRCSVDSAQRHHAHRSDDRRATLHVSDVQNCVDHTSKRTAHGCGDRHDLKSFNASRRAAHVRVRNVIKYLHERLGRTMARGMVSLSRARVFTDDIYHAVGFIQNDASCVCY